MIKNKSTLKLEVPYKGWHSWDPTPWNHPWLTPENLKNMRDYSKRKLCELKKLTEGDNPQKYRFGFCGGMANNLYLRLVPLRGHGLSIQMFLHPDDEYVMSYPAWEEFEGILEDDETNIKKVEKNGIKLPKVTGVECHPADLHWEKYLKSFPPFLLDPTIIDRFPSYMSHIHTYLALQKVDAILTTQVPYFGYLSGKPYCAISSGGEMWYEASRGDELGILQRTSFEKANMILVTNPWTYAHARRYDFKHLIYLPLILDQNVYKPGLGKSRKMWEEKSGGSFFILATARLDEYYKGFSYWVDALSEFLNLVSNARLCIIKWGNDKNLFLEKAIELGFQDKILWLPLSGKETIRDYLRSADCLVDQFSVGYYGATALEAMACGLPVIARFETAQYDAFCETGAPPILQSESKEDILSHLLNLFNSVEFREVTAKNHRKWFLENHGSERWIPDYLAVLLATAGGKTVSFEDSSLAEPITSIEREYHLDGLDQAPIFPHYSHNPHNFHKFVEKRSFHKICNFFKRVVRN